ncbi:uncharacterized protein LOC126978092 isoform X2 [Leptidea sinapis]|uniref:uncharacterized protein LOC126978092 isoform X2 n=1 Tax=Leptidea sinapis TaxID=189913 RepID=UPI0021C4C3D4|nr:uncharacterized protein LOC126978092 isoform X2 [Leptidea sinapis]
MIMKRSLLENITLISCSSTVICAIFNSVTNSSFITGWWFIGYALIVFIISLVLSFKLIQYLLHLNKPISFDIKLLNKYTFVRSIQDFLPQIHNKQEIECKEYDTNELSVITTVLEKKLVSSWYIYYISKEISFPFACKQLLDQIISKAFQICNHIETKEVYVHLCGILISHLKEYKKAIKRHEKANTLPIESLYKKSHVTATNQNQKTATSDHCVKIIWIIMKELVPWELWDTPHSELLVRILAKKLDIFIKTTISDPVWLNDRLVAVLTEEAEKPAEEHKAPENIDIDEKMENNARVGNEVEVNNAEIKNESKMTDEIKLSDSETKQDKDDCIEATEITPGESTDDKPVLRQRRGRQGKSEVKIYDRVIEGSVKTWETDMDLQCISMGQDLLASLDGLTLSRLWGQEDTEQSPNQRRHSPQPLWFGEEDTIDEDSLEPTKEKRETSPKATDLLLKDIQSTVNQAKTKIGDLQDEAAGMMEGLFDKGIAGIKKGLRFTGLSDESQEKYFPHNEKSGDRMSPDAIKSRRTNMVADYRQTTPASDGNSAPILIKQQRVTSQDSMAHGQVKPKLENMPFSLSDSPEPQYEETADLSHTIAKLRSLLNEATATPRGEEVWWESAEETRGRTQRHHTERQVDTASLADEYDMTLERNAPASPEHINNMQRLDKLFQRTVTGVFNTIRGAVGAEGEEGGPVENSGGAECWSYVCTSLECTVGGAVSRLVGSRRAVSHVDAALDSLHQLPSGPRLNTLPAPLQAHPDDFEEWCMSEGRAWCGLWETLGEMGLSRSHLATRIVTLLFADVAEKLLDSWLREFTAWLRKQVFEVFEKMSEDESECYVTNAVMREMDIDETCRLVIEKLPGALVFGEETVKNAVHLLVSSFSHSQLNQDLALRILDLMTSHYVRAAAIRNPSYDNN